MEKPWLAHYESAVPPTLTYPAITLSQTLEDSVRKFPDHCAAKLVLRYVGDNSLGVSLSYRELADEVDHFAAALHALGVRKGDRVALMLPNLPQFVIAFYGAIKLGAIVVNTNPHVHGSREIEHQFADAGAETVIMLSPFYSRLKEVQARTPVKRVILTDVPDYLAAPAGQAVRAASCKRTGMMVDVPERAADGGASTISASCSTAHPEPPPAVEVAAVRCGAVPVHRAAPRACPRPPCSRTATLVANIMQISDWIVQHEGGEGAHDGRDPLLPRLRHDGGDGPGRYTWPPS